MACACDWPGAGTPLPVYVGMRNWHPFLGDTLAAMARAGVRRAIGFIAAAHRSYSSCTQYRENVADARAALAAQGLPDVEVTFTADWHTHPGFIDANVDHIEQARQQLPESLRERAKLVFTAHSIPVSMAERYPYQQQFEESVGEGDGRATGRAAEAARSTGCATVYQSRSGRPEDPWLGPDICDYLRDERSRGLEAAVICADRIRQRSRRGAVRLGRRGGRRLPRDRSTDGACRGSQRSSSLPRRDD